MDLLVVFLFLGLIVVVIVCVQEDKRDTLCRSAGYGKSSSYASVCFCIGFDRDGQLKVELYEDVRKRLEE